MRTIRTEENRDAFITALTKHGNVTWACEQCGLSRVAVYAWRHDDEDFKDAWEAALEVGCDGLEDEALRRGAEGWDEPVFFQGQECGVIRRYSDALLIRMLQARRPEKFKDRRENTGIMQHTGAGGGPIQARASITVQIGDEVVEKHEGEDAE